MNEEQVHVACAHFDRYGGSFLRGLARLWRIADQTNKTRLMRAFADEFHHGYRQALAWAEYEKGEKV